MWSASGPRINSWFWDHFRIANSQLIVSAALFHTFAVLDIPCPALQLVQHHTADIEARLDEPLIW